MNKKRLYVSEQSEWNKEISQTSIEDNELNVRVVKNGYVLPLRIQAGHDVTCGCAEGGVCDENGAWITGSADSEHAGFTCNKGYTFRKEETTYVDKKVIYGGVFYKHFGVMLMRSLARLWWLAEEKEHMHVVFLLEPDKPEKARNYASQVMSVLTRNQDWTYSFVEKITQFTEIIVPDEAYSSHYHLNRMMILPYNIMMANSQSSTQNNYKKVYLSRGSSRNDGINEEYYEKFFGDLGFKVFSFSDLCLTDLISIISNAEELAYTYGTIANAAVLFSDNNTIHICLLRANDVDWWFPLHYNLMQLRKLDWFIVEATMNPYPMFHDMGNGAYLYFPTKQFEEFVHENICAEYKRPKKMPLNLIAQYSLLWASKHVYRPDYFKSLNRPDLFPLLQQYASVILRKKLDKKKYIEQSAYNKIK